jgi:hypothetical protein
VTEDAEMIATSQMFAASARGSRPQPPADRQALRPDELVQAINGLLATRPECEGLAMEAGPLAPAHPDHTGCNWRPHGLRLRVEHGPSTRALACVRDVVELARMRYDLAEWTDA